MPKIKLTQKTVDKQKAPTASGKPILLWDVELRGFGLLLSGKTASKCFVVVPPHTVLRGALRRVENFFHPSPPQGGGVTPPIGGA